MPDGPCGLTFSGIQGGLRRRCRGPSSRPREGPVPGRRPGARHRLAHPRLGLIDDPGHVVRGQVRVHLDLGDHQQLIRAEVQVCSWSSWAIPGVEASVRRIAACSWGEAASPTSRLNISIPNTTATTASSAPIARVPGASYNGSPVSWPARPLRRPRSGRPRPRCPPAARRPAPGFLVVRMNDLQLWWPRRGPPGPRCVATAPPAPAPPPGSPRRPPATPAHEDAAASGSPHAARTATPG